MASDQKPARALFSPVIAPAGAAPGTAHGKEVVRSRPVKIDVKLLSAYAGTGDQSGHSITLNLFDDVNFVAQSDKIERNERGIVWTGKIKGVDMSQVLIVANDDVVSGNITMPKARYHIRFVGNGVHEVQRIDSTQFKND